MRSCKIWQGPVSNGYPVIRGSDGHYRKARRVVWEAAYGSIPDGRAVKTTCSNTLCIALSHLYVRPERVRRLRLLPQTVRAIRRWARCGKSRHLIARRFSVSELYVNKIVRGEVRRDVQGK